MRFVYTTYNADMLEQMESLLWGLEISVYRVTLKTPTRSNSDIPRKDTTVWLGSNACLLVQETGVSKRDAPLRRIRKMNAQVYSNSELVAAYLWSADTYVAPESIMSVQECDLLSGA